MLPAVFFYAVGLVGWFGTSQAYPDPRAAVCAFNDAPKGTTLLLYYGARSATCKVVGTVTEPGYYITVSQTVRAELKFKVATDVEVFRLIGYIKKCPSLKPACKPPLEACVLPIPAIDICGIGGS